MTCTLSELPSGIGDAFSPVSARSTRQIVRGRSGPHAMGSLAVLDTSGEEHESIAVSYDESLELATELQRYLAGTLAQFDGALYDFRFGLVLAGLLTALSGLALHAALSRSGWAELVLDGERERLTVTRKWCALALSRTELDVRGAHAVDIDWLREEPKRAPSTDLSARLWLHTSNGSAFIPERYARGAVVHLRGAAALRELLGLSPVDTQIYEPSAMVPKRELRDRIEGIVVGAACGATHGFCLPASVQFWSGPRPSPVALSSGWLIVAGAALEAFIALCWSQFVESSARRPA